MEFKAKLNARNRITIPIKLRRQLEMEPGDRVEFSFKDGDVFFRKADPAREASPKQAVESDQQGSSEPVWMRAHPID